MKTLYFKCTLLSDVILSESAATSGHQSTLDFIPGSNFMGICAKSMYNDKDENMLPLFHTGDVQFGDAHVMHKGIRTLRIPASMYYPKLKNVEEECYIHHGLPAEGTDDQLKQCRKGFYAFTAASKEIQKAEVGTTYAIKSAYDYDKRRSEDEKLYGYESMEKGLEFLFEVRLNDQAEEYAGELIKVLKGEHTLGRSKTAQFGLVDISVAQPDAFPDYNCKTLSSLNGKPVHVVYADSRLIFIDENTLLPKFRIEANDLGFTSGKINWGLSQVRTFQYAPWNTKRQNRDADRCGIEKGSVIVVEGATELPKSDVVGNFKSEGFGKVIFNPSFLEFKAGGLATWSFVKEDKDDDKKKQATDINAGGNALLGFIKAKAEEEKEDAEIMKAVNGFVKDNLKPFKGEQFASQWGTIRMLANRYSKDEIKREIDKYLDHGVAKDKWEKNGGKLKLNEFLKTNKNLDIKKLVINLASQMQKAIR